MGSIDKTSFDETSIKHHQNFHLKTKFQTINKGNNMGKSIKRLFIEETKMNNSLLIIAIILAATTLTQGYPQKQEAMVQPGKAYHMDYVKMSLHHGSGCGGYKFWL